MCNFLFFIYFLFSGATGITLSISMETLFKADHSFVYYISYADDKYNYVLFNGRYSQ